LVVDRSDRVYNNDMYQVNNTESNIHYTILLEVVLDVVYNYRLVHKLYQHTH
jgi:hypothetical protein